MTVPDDPLPPADPTTADPFDADPFDAGPFDADGGEEGGRRRARWPRRSRRRRAASAVGTTGARFGPPANRHRLDDDSNASDGSDEPGATEITTVVPAVDVDGTGAAEDPFVGLTGARFGSPALRRRWQEDLTADQRNRQRDPLPDGPRTAPPRPRQGTTAQTEDIVPEEQESLRTLVRPYTWTGGRTAPRYDLGLETLVSASDDAARWDEEQVSAEFRRVAALCARPRSVAEVAASLSIPLGVARVLLGDMAVAGSIVVHRSATADGMPDLALMERVLHGLRRL
ncbi:Protein of unknown function (DUF742) [Streptoalloteichus tenebrarius]|uniref:DUF742 domain-containing protein n=1 Tax=Streptoalloteichus tenebrarius (strain ATCC 17920 / DSM 40477 / JCM 4838 / CBS 697.72 / NBRC 16177 / NCIMB 11028 / NRRL B-12390 / A12253. 1 / ISP 5477) TaxID=1933 RepID=A0ABT1I2A1_STRSD|nr:DUF742 domain-containing protein [Streptoalloteichus tenebrarius]MCP2261851.1 Protein of unknown function (DUF742) [Streptoalloteichus tenebrarius]BFE99997.1 hypothetical protein GCM10020241_16730 [Streptoalloteichus tenebrarius]